MASPGSAIGVVLPFAGALSGRAGLWGSEAEAPAGLTSGVSFLGELAVGSRRRGLPANRACKCQPGPGQPPAAGLCPWTSHPVAAV